MIMNENKKFMSIQDEADYLGVKVMHHLCLGAYQTDPYYKIGRLVKLGLNKLKNGFKTRRVNTTRSLFRFE